MPHSWNKSLAACICLDKLVKKGPFRSMAFVSDRTTISAGFPTGRQLQHDRVLAMWMSLSLSNDLESSRKIVRLSYLSRYTHRDCSRTFNPMLR